MIRHYLRAIAIGLIIFPEPITTAIGVALLTATFAIPRNNSLKKFKHMEALIQRSYKRPERYQFEQILSDRRNMVYHKLLRDPALRPTSMTRPENSLRSPRSTDWFDNRQMSEKVLHHTLKTSLPQYESATSRFSARTQKSSPSLSPKGRISLV